MQQISFRKLPPQVREKLLKRRRGETEECVVIETGGLSLWYFLLPLSIVWLGLFFYLTDSYLWSTPYLVTLSLLTLAATYVLISGLYGVFSQFVGIEPALIFTRFYVIEVGRGTVRYWKLDELLNIISKNNYNGHQYISTDFNLNFSDDTERNFVLRNIDQAEDVLEKIEYLRKVYFENHSGANVTIDRTEDDFYEVTAFSSASATNVVSQIGLSIVAILIAFGAIYAAVQMNEYFDDRRSWDAALATNQAAPVRDYRQTHPRGRWLREAGEKLEQMYDAAEQKYKASLQEGYDPKAADAVIAVLKYARASQNLHIKISFERQNNVPANIAEELKKEYGYKTVLPLHSALSDEKLKELEGRLVSIIASAFRRIIPEDILEFSDTCEGECVAFSVKYTIDADSVYYPTEQKELPELDRTYYPGIFIDWNFGVQIPGQPDSFAFDLESLPANQISYDSDLDEATEKEKGVEASLEANKSRIYDSMIKSAFADFRSNLIYRMGIGGEDDLNINKIDEEPTPEADRGELPEGTIY